jgi:hypothetical protein
MEEEKRGKEEEKDRHHREEKRTGIIAERRWGLSLDGVGVTYPYEGIPLSSTRGEMVAARTGTIVERLI